MKERKILPEKLKLFAAEPTRHVLTGIHILVGLHPAVSEEISPLRGVLSDGVNSLLQRLGSYAARIGGKPGMPRVFNSEGVNSLLQRKGSYTAGMRMPGIFMLLYFS